MTEVVAALRSILGDDRVVTDPDVLAPHLVDWTGRFRGGAEALVRPRSTQEVAAILAACRAHRTPLVTQGGRSGLVGGGVPTAGGVLLSTAALDAAPRVDPVAGHLVAGAGVTLAAVQQAATEAGWRYPVDLAARDSATIGGTVATNAGGTHVVRHGMTRRHLLGVEAVLGTGAVVSRLHGLPKDNTGYDLAGLLCGSEGTLGIVTAVCLALSPPVVETATALVGTDDLDTAVALVGAARRSLPDLEAAEAVLAAGVDLVAEVTGVTPPLRPVPPVTILLEVAGAPGAEERLVAFLADADHVGATAVADDEARRAQLWLLREEHTTALATLGVPHKYDVTLPLPALGRTVAEVDEVVRDLAPTARLWAFGHLGDGNLHLNVTGLAPDDTRVDEAVLATVARAGGSISAEHGIGVAKARWLHLAHDADEVATYQALKATFDPDGILNPGVLVSAPPAGPPPTGRGR